MMELSSSLSVCIVISLLCSVNCDENADIVNERLDLLENEMKGLPDKFKAINDQMTIDKSGLKYEMKTLSDKFNVIVNQMTYDKSDLINKQKRQIISLKRNLRAKIQKDVKKALAGKLGEENNGMVQSNVISELRHVHRANQQMRRQMNEMKASFRQVEADSAMYRDALKRSERENIDRGLQIEELIQQLRGKNGPYTLTTEQPNSDADSTLECSVCLNSEQLTNTFSRFGRQMDELNQTLMQARDSCELSNISTTLARYDRQFDRLNQTLREYNDSSRLSDITNKFSRYDRQIDRLNQTLREYNDSSKLSDITNKFSRYDRQIGRLNQTLMQASDSRELSNISTTLARYDRQFDSLNKTLREYNDSSRLSDITNKFSTYDRQIDRLNQTLMHQIDSSIHERSRILVVPVYETVILKPHQIDLHTNSFTVYPHLSLKYYRSVLYVYKINSLLIGFQYPKRIIISELNSPNYVTIRNHVLTDGMTADEGRDLVFLTTWNPKTVSRMGYRGENFTSLARLSGIYNYPYSIAVHPLIKTIYACNFDHLYTLLYDGSGVRKLDTGGGIGAVTLDIMNGLLFYSKSKKVMKMSLSSEVSSEVTKLEFQIYNLIHYKHKVYYSSRDKRPPVFGVINIGQNMLSNQLQTLNMSDSAEYALCLIP